MAFAMSKLRSQMNSYAAALGYYDNCTPWRGEGDAAERPLKERRVRHMGVRLKPDQSVAFRLWNTEVVTWHPDNTLTLVPYASPTTDAFAQGFTPWGLGCCFNSGYVTVCRARGENHTFLRTTGQMHFAVGDDACVQLLSTPKPWKVYRMDRKQANAARKATGFKDFKLWVTAMQAMGGQVERPPRVYHWATSATKNDDALMEMLADRARWVELLQRFYSDAHALDMMDRLSLKRGHPDGPVARVEERATLSSYREFNAVRAQRKRLGMFA